jgi:hypothetical protein
MRVGSAGASSYRGHLYLRGVLLFATLALPIVFLRMKSVTEDEIVHLPAGYSYLVTGRVVLNPMHPPLVKELCALPLLFLNLEMPVDQETLSRSADDVTYQRKFGSDFLSQPGRDRAVFWGRLPAVLLSLALAIVVARWATELWGAAAGSLALFLYAFDPTIDAHAQFVTTDVGLALFATSFLYALRRYLRDAGTRWLIACGVALGLALGTKFTGLILVPLAAFLIGASWIAGRRGQFSPALRAFVVVMTIAYCVLWLIYLCPRDPLFYWHDLETLKQDNDPRYLNFLMGHFRAGRWPVYFPIAWLVKTPLPSLILLAASGVLFVRGIRRERLEEAFIIAPAITFFAGYSLFADPGGVRYLIPCFPFFFIFAARVASVKSRALSAAVAGLLVWYAGEFVAISPDQLSYFNQLAGGSRGGVQWLDDSNVDWGQGLIELRSYLREHPAERYRLCCFGCLDPKSYGIDAEPIWISGVLSPPSGTLILSAHCVARARAWLHDKYGDGPGNWLAHTDPRTIVGHAYYVYEIGS